MVIITPAIELVSVITSPIKDKTIPIVELLFFSFFLSKIPIHKPTIDIGYPTKGKSQAIKLIIPKIKDNLEFLFTFIPILSPPNYNKYIYLIITLNKNFFQDIIIIFFFLLKNILK